MDPLSALMRKQLLAGGVIIPGACDLHMEVMDTTTGLVWMSVEVASQQDYNDLRLDDSLRGVGIGAAAMDAALFQYSPNAESEPVRERDISGHRFICVARPEKPRALPGGMVELMVNKAHLLGYQAGRKVTVLSLPEGDFVEVVGDAAQDSGLTLPEGGALQSIVLQAPWLVPLPNPSKTIWQFGDKMRSFQGPVILPPGA